MATHQLRKVIYQLRRAALGGAQEALTDEELLGGFVARRDEAAFETLVERHGPMVLGVCRRVLRNAHDVEDAFQATFLILVRRAASIKRPELVGNWLYGVAYRTARAARVKAARRRAKESPMHDMEHADLEPEAAWQQLQPLLDRELTRLPDKYRMPLILCELEGRTRKEVARQLEIPEGTLSSRLATAKKTLARRLNRAGLSLSAGFLAVLLSEKATSARLPASMMAAALKSATLFGSGHGSTTSVISADVVALTESVVRSMFLVKLRLTMILVVAALVGGLGIILAQPAPAARQQDPRPAAKKPTRIVVPASLVIDGKAAYSIISINPDTGAWKKLTGPGRWPRVSPDGQTVVFIDGSHDSICNCDTGGSDNPGKLFDWSGYGGPMWSPDGKHLYYSSLTASIGGHVWQHQTWRRDADGGNPVKLKIPAAEAILDIAPDGQYCLTRSRFITSLNSSALMLMKLDGTGSRRLSAPGGFNEPARFAPDGRHVAYCRGDSQGFSVWTAKRDGTANRKVFGEGGVFVEGCCWSPDSCKLAVVAADLMPGPNGKQIIPYGRQEGHWRIELLDADGQNQLQVPLKAKVTALREPDWHRLTD